METITEPQAWVLIGTFTTAIFGLMAILTASTNRVIRAEIGGLRHEMNGKIDGLQHRMDGTEARLTTKIDALDRDVQAIARHVFGEPT